MPGAHFLSTRKHHVPATITASNSLRRPGAWRWLQVLLLALGSLLILSGCGFHLKGSAELPYQSMYTNIDLNSEFGARLARIIQANAPGLEFTNNRKDAEVALLITNNQESLRQLSIDPDGRVDEYELNLDLDFHLTDQNGDELLAPTSLKVVREMPYNERIVQAKESEITRTFNQMRNLLIDQILRRISSPDVLEAYHASRLRTPENNRNGSQPADLQTPISQADRLRNTSAVPGSGWQPMPNAAQTPWYADQ